MVDRNVSLITDNPELNLGLFVLLLLIYVITVVGNFGVIMIIVANVQLHSPKYFFLSQLAFLDFCYSSVFILKMLVTFMVGHKVIPYHGCLLCQHVPDYRMLPPGCNGI